MCYSTIPYWVHFYLTLKKKSVSEINGITQESKNGPGAIML